MTDRLVCDIVLRDGSTLALRHVQEADLPRLTAFFGALSPDSRYYRFFSLASLDYQSVHQLMSLSRESGTALVGEVANRVVVFAGYYKTPGVTGRAEVAFSIVDRFQGRGIGIRLLERLTELARTEGMRTFDAFVMGGKRKMLAVFLDSGHRISREIEGGITHVELSLEPTAEHVQKSARRSQLAATASMKAFFEPRTVARRSDSRITRGRGPS